MLFQNLEPRTVMDGTAIISEVLTANSGGLKDIDGDSSDWIELYNPSPEPVNLQGWHLTDTKADLNEWEFPSVSLLPNAFLTVFASGKNRAVAGSELHTNFKLTTTGEYLALIKPTGVVATEFSPTYPPQASNVSYGPTFQVNTLVSQNFDSKVLVPTFPIGTSWTQPQFNASSWLSKNGPIGFGAFEPGFDVKFVKANTQVNDLNTALSVLSTPALQMDVVNTSAPSINYFGSGGNANFGNDLLFPTQAVGQDYDDFVLEATSSIQIPSAGNWTFGVNSDDGFLLELSKDGTVFSSQYAYPRAASDTLATFNITAVGTWKVRLVMFEGGGGSEVEFFAAKGSYSSFDQSVFRLIGDTTAGGIASNRSLLISSNLQGGMQGFNASAYIRIPFDANAPSNYQALIFRIRYDDGFIAYLNGVEVARRNAPASAAFNSSATSQRSIPAVAVEESISLTAFLGLLTNGQNILAIQGLNSNASDSSFLIAPKLEAVSANVSTPRYFATPTPNAPNATPYLGVVDRVTSNVDGGFFSSSFIVSLGSTTSGATLRYTTDGSTPTESHGTLYSGPITVSGTTTLRAIAFKTDFVSLPTISRTYLFLADVVNQSPTGAAPVGWPSTWGNNVVDYGMDPDIISREGVQVVKNALLAIPTLAVSTDLPNLFDPTTGIYTSAFNDGRDWERPASLELINPDGSAGFQVNAGIRIRGGYSRNNDNPKHSFRFFFRGEYGDSSLDYPLFGDEGAKSFQKIDLRTAQNYSWSFGGDPSNTFISDIVNRETQRDLGQPYTRSRWYHLYIDGQYWGLYQTQERAEAEFAASYFGGLASNYDVMKTETGPYITIPTDGNDQAYRRLWEASVQGFSNNVEYQKIQGKNPDGTDNTNYEVLLDVDNLAVYMMNILYSGNLDAPISQFLGNNAVNNFFAIRDRTGREGFKYFLHDSEHTFLPWDLYENRNGPYPAGSEFQYFNPQWLHQRLMENSDYRIRFADLVQKAFFNNGPLSLPVERARYQNEIDQINLAIIAESARWGDAKRPNDPLGRSNWLDATANIRDNYFRQREPIVLDQWRSIGLFPNVAAPTFLLNGSTSTGGHINEGSNLKFGTNGGLVYYTKDGSDPRLSGGGLNPGALIYDPLIANVDFITSGTTWRFFDKGTDLGTAWRSGSFNDAAWSQGNAELGYGDGDEATQIGFGGNVNDRFITSYFRKNFSVANPAVVTDLHLRLKRDDGAVVYVNGVEVVRDNLPAGPINASTLAVNAIVGTDESTFYDYTIPASVLIAGNNVIAVEIHQAAATSSDLSFDLALSAVTQSNPGFTLNTTTTFNARTLANDGSWSALSNATFATAIPAAAGNLVITELMYNPPAVAPNELAVDKEEFEFIEFRNISTQPIDLAGVHFSEGVVANFTNGSVRVLNAGQVVVLAKNVAAFRSRYGNGPLVTGAYTSGSLNNGGEKLTLLAADNSEIQSFTYDDVAPWSTAPDGAGPSLTVRWIDRNYDDGTNWRASFVAKGTPGVVENDFPEQLNMVGNVIGENAPNATVGILSAVDPNRGDLLSFSIQPGSNWNQFQIVGNQLRVGSVGLDFEASNSRTVLVRATDPGGLFIDRSFTIQVTNVNESPTAILLSNAILTEGQAIGTNLGTLSTVDPDIGGAFAYLLVPGNGSTDNSLFTLAGNSLSTAAILRIANKSSYSIRIRSTDAQGLFIETPFVISLTPVANTPSVTNASTVRNAMTKSGLVITRNVANGAEITHFRITSILGGSLFLNDGTTAVAEGSFVTAAQGTAGLKFLPTLNSLTTGSFQVQAATGATLAQVSGGPASATISIQDLIGIQSIAINAGRTSPSQRSMVMDVTVTFTGLVTINSGAFEIRRIDLATPPLIATTVTPSTVNGKTVVRITFSGTNTTFGSLVDGRYRLIIHADKILDSLTYQIDGDANGIQGGDRLFGEGTTTQSVDNFFRLYGDTDGSGSVGSSDVIRFRTAIGKKIGQLGYLWYLDADGANGTDNGDLLRMRISIGKRLNRS